MIAHAPTPGMDTALLYSVARTPEQLEERYGKSLEEMQATLASEEGREELMRMFQAEHPELNGKAKEILDYLSLNVEQLKKKETLMQKVLSLPKRAISAIWETIKKHPILSAVAVLALLLYFLPMPPGLGRFGDKFIEAVKGLLAKSGISVPEVATDALADAPVTGGPVSEELVEKIHELIQSPSGIDEVNRNLLEAMKQ